MSSRPEYLADFSLALINRTGAYHVCRDILRGLPQFFPAVRYWRFQLGAEPQGLIRKLMGRSMLLELNRLGGGRPTHGESRDLLPTLYFDPLYVLRTTLRSKDIVLCHDLGPITHPELFDEKTHAMYVRAYEYIRATKPGMVFVSEASKKDFLRLYGADYPFVEVIPLYVRPNVQEVEGVAPPGVRKPFLLTVGALERRKNHARIIAAFKASGLGERGYSYVLCGPNGNSAREVDELTRGVASIRRLGYLSDAEVRWLYVNATGFVLPSLLEGFGLPPLEAAQRGLPSVVSRGGAQEEAVGSGAILVDPLSEDEIAAGMLTLADMPAEERSRRVALLQQQAATLSYERYLQKWSALLSRAAKP